MRLKTLKELVDEFGDVYFTHSGFLRRHDHPLAVHKDYLNKLGKEVKDGTPMPEWVIKKPEVKKLYAYEWILVDDGYHPECLKTTIFSPHDFSGFTRWKNKRQPEFDLEFPNDISK